jgi:nucleotide-binding universal stress UspA family protein
MAFRDILVYLDPTSESLERLRLAVELAKTHGARLIGVDISARASENAPVTGRTFDEATRAVGLDAVFVPAEKPGDGEALTHCIDLVVAPAPNGPVRDVLNGAAIDRTLTESGVPMLILPHDWTESSSVGRNIVIAWNGGREALRAVHDAMPFLENAAKVTIFAFSSRPSDLRASAELLARHLKAHGVISRVSDWTNTGDLSAIDALFASLDTQDADLIVAGAFGHSRLYESLFGGVSLDLMRQQAVPVLMSH